VTTDTDFVSVPREELVRWKTLLADHWFSGSGEESYNNEEVIEVSDCIDRLLKGLG
jgi:hypothetical protein